MMQTAPYDSSGSLELSDDKDLGHTPTTNRPTDRDVKVGDFREKYIYRYVLKTVQDGTNSHRYRIIQRKANMESRY